MINETISITLNPDLKADIKDAFLVPVKGGTPVLIDGIVKVGRESGNDVRLDDPYVSAQHCQFEKRPLGYFVRDLKSRNGVLIDGLKVGEGQLLNGSEIQIGETTFVFQTQSQSRDDAHLPLRSKNSQWMSQLETLIPIAQTQLPVFLQGESGTGKEVVAHIIHDQSERHEGPFVSVNCSALTETLVESELFGHVRGSFTGATGDRKGAFEAARGGTLFLDEIGDLPLSLQPKLLRALENQEIRPVGSDKTTSTDVRIVTATHKNLDRLVSEGRFRADLYFRVHVIKIAIPALRDRMEDFEDLLYYFCRENRVRFSVAAIETMKKHSWPGNIRELKNTIARAKALYPQTQIQPEHVKQLIVVPPPLLNLADLGADGNGQVPLLKEVEREMIKARLAANNGNQRKTAADLGMPKSTLHDRIKAYNIEIRSLCKI